jgi:DNA-binding transcriptional MerR regulator
MAEDYTLEDLERMSGMSIRTLRFYIQEGLLPGPDTRGKFARYSKKHIDTIRFIHRLKEVHMPLQQIRHLLDTMSSGDIERIIQSKSESNFTFSSPQPFSKDENREVKSVKPERSSVLDYIRSLENLQDSLKVNDSNTRYMAPSAPSQAPPPPSKVYISQPANNGETWHRIRLAEDVELQVRQPMSREREQVVEELIEITRQLFRKINKKGEKSK